MFSSPGPAVWPGPCGGRIQPLTWRRLPDPSPAREPLQHRPFAAAGPQRERGPAHRIKRLIRDTWWRWVISPCLVKRNQQLTSDSSFPGGFSLSKSISHMSIWLVLTVVSHRNIVYAGEVQAFHEDLGGRQFINEVYKFGVDKMYDLLFTESDFMRDFREQRRFSGKVRGISTSVTLLHLDRIWSYKKVNNLNKRKGLSSS